MNTADKTLMGVPIGARAEAGLELKQGDTVWLVTDPVKELGRVELKEAGRFFVRWSNGRTWIYPSADLILGVTLEEAKELGLY